jgi:hypothetical protein
MQRALVKRTGQEGLVEYLMSGGWGWSTAMYSSHSKPNSKPGIGPKGTDAQHHQTDQQRDSLHNRASNIEVEAKKVIAMIKSNKVTRAA